MGDLRYAFRILSKQPGVTVVALLALALGIGANAAIFSVVKVVLLAPLPYRDAERLVMVWETSTSKDYEIAPVSPADFVDWKAQNRVFESMAGSRDATYSLTGIGEPESIPAYRFSAEFFGVTGVKPLLGRTFLPEEDHRGADRVVVLSHRLWVRRFGADPGVLSSTITLNGGPYIVIGVMPPEFRHPQHAEMWTPLALDPRLLENRRLKLLRIMARLRPGVSLEQAQAEMELIVERLAEQYPDTNRGNGVKVVSLRDEYAGDMRPVLLVLMASVGFVLLIACANVANLLLARAAGRQREIAIRTALGAGRPRLIRQLLTESLLLGMLGGLGGLLLAFWGTRLLLALFPNNIANLSIPLVEQIPVDWTVVGFTFCISLATSVVFGLAPALQGSRPFLTETLKDTGPGVTAGRKGKRLRAALIIAEAALTLVLSVGACLALKSLLVLRQGELGINTENLLTLQLLLPQYKYDSPEKRRAFVRDVIGGIRSLPGVTTVGATNFLPLTGFLGVIRFTEEGQPLPRPGDEPLADNRVATEDYFGAMGIKALKGRVFDSRDHENGRPVLVINETLARRNWPNEDPVGKRLNLGNSAEPDWWEVVGVVSDVKSFGLEEETHADVYRPYWQVPFPLIAFTIRAATEPEALMTAVRDEVWAVDKDQPIFKMISMERLASESLALRRVSTILLGSFAGLALVLAAIGMYGVTSYTVQQQTREMGLRMALGASRRDVVRLVLRRGLANAIVGVAIGLAGAALLTGLLSAILYGVAATDPVSFIGAAAALIGVALPANYIPAMRAARMDPVSALRHD